MGEKGTKMNNSSESAQLSLPQPGIPLEFVAWRGTKTGNLPENAQLPLHASLTPTARKFGGRDPHHSAAVPGHRGKAGESRGRNTQIKKKRSREKS